MIRFIIWIVFFYAVYHFIRTAIRGAINKGIKDHEIQKESQRRKEKEIKIDRKDIEDAKYEDIK